jgi:hypothetical protein
MGETGDKPVLREWPEPDGGWDEKRARRLVWKTRIALWFSVLQMVLVVFFLYAVYAMVTQVVYGTMGMDTQFVRYVTTLVETHHAGYRIDKLDDDDTTLSPLLTQETRLTLYKQIGEWGVVVGSVHATKRLFGDVRYEVNFQRKYLEEDGGFSFAVPPQLLGQPLPERKETADMWEQWKHVDDGHVAELAFSTREPMTPEKLLELLRPYNLKVLQMPVYAGELQEFSISHASAGGYAFVPHLVLRPAVQYRGRGMSIQDDLNHSVEAAKAQLPADLEWLLANGSYDGRDYDEKRLAYVKKNGITVYGAVVTGPIRELERLRQEKMFHSFQFGRIETWNW